MAAEGVEGPGVGEPECGEGLEVVYNVMEVATASVRRRAARVSRNLWMRSRTVESQVTLPAKYVVTHPSHWSA